MEPVDISQEKGLAIEARLVDRHDSPFDTFAHEEVRARVESELREVPEPYRTTLVLRDLEGMSYDEIAEITQVSLGTVKSRLTRGREALRRRLAAYVKEVGPELGLIAPEEAEAEERSQMSNGRNEFE